MPPYRVLVVDDERDFRHLMTMFLKRSDLPLDVEVVGNGVDAICRAQERRPDLILLDIMMPGMDGFEVGTRLRADERTRSVPILILTALDAPERASALVDISQDFLAKPFERGQLLSRVRRILERTYGYDSAVCN
jgi:DNA-binding response OmpR family regulator